MKNSNKPGPVGLEDPTVNDLKVVSKFLAGEIPMVGRMFGLIVGQSNENDRYDRLLPVTLKMIELTGVDSIESQTLLYELAETRPLSRRGHFMDYYIKEQLNWKKLPKKADEIRYGY